METLSFSSGLWPISNPKWLLESIKFLFLSAGQQLIYFSN